MRKLTFLLFIFLAVGPIANGQDKPILEYDLYGCWKLERNKKENGIKKRIYNSCEKSNRKIEVRNSEITLLAGNKCIFQAVIQDALCPVIYKTVEATWTYNSKSGIAEIFYPKNFKEEFWEKVKEEHPDLIIHNPRPYKRFKITFLDKNRMEIEKLSTTMAIENRAKN
ncbi:hypothetical protein M4I21_07505 [Cellulophaga sp. 20_2_10]|uniref:hypothetical protein n=1 Tax=Cellulophaga sp. 20_2_10 TaxID=2942476 RepID=UPI00201A8E44|nr:hypothetical protein [Cellulophaga sp. 20_2_10]MCL5245648.1 hypothetical protein [Cellulophaga sp. 20_2_10]